MNSSDSAEEAVRLILQGTEVAFRVAGIGAKNMAVIIYTIMKEQKQTKGKTRLTNMLKTGKPLKIFTIRAEDLKKFSQEAKKYGVLYCALADKKNSKIDGMVDILVREEDAPKMNRIAERFNFREIASIRKELEKDKNIVKSQEEILESEEDSFINDIMPKTKEDLEKKLPSNKDNTEEKNQSEISLNTKLQNTKTTMFFEEEKPSVKEELKRLEQELIAKEKENNTIETTIISDKKINKKEKHQGKHKGKHYKEPKHLNKNSNVLMFKKGRRMAR